MRILVAAVVWAVVARPMGAGTLPPAALPRIFGGLGCRGARAPLIRCPEARTPLALRGGGGAMFDVMDDESDVDSDRGDDAVEKVMKDATKGRKDSEIKASTKAAVEQMKEAAKDGKFSVDVGGGYSVPMFDGDPPAEWEQGMRDEWDRYRAQLRGISTAEDALSIELADAAGNGTTARCVELIEDGADPNFPDPREWLSTPLMRAAKGGHYETCLALLDMGADTSVTDVHGSTALLAAAADGHANVTLLLLRAGSDLNHTNEVGNNALHKAAAHGRLEVTLLLLKSGADVLSRNEDGSMPLHLAAFFGHAKVCRLLVQYGARTDVEDNEGNTAPREAKLMGRHECLKFFASLNDDRSWDRPFTGNTYYEWEKHIAMEDEIVRRVAEGDYRAEDMEWNENDKDSDDDGEKGGGTGAAGSKRTRGVKGKPQKSKAEVVEEEEEGEEEEEEAPSEHIESSIGVSDTESPANVLGTGISHHGIPRRNVQLAEEPLFRY